MYYFWRTLLGQKKLNCWFLLFEKLLIVPKINVRNQVSSHHTSINILHFISILFNFLNLFSFSTFKTFFLFRSKLVHFLVRYRNKWVCRGYDTPIAKALVFKKMQAVVGGRLRMLLSGGAPLSDEAHVFIRTCLCVNVHQGYGLTETGAVACVTDERDISTGKSDEPVLSTS